MGGGGRGGWTPSDLVSDCPNNGLFVLVHNGKLLTPKSILSPYEIKELTKNCELITTANRLGHGISYSKLQEILSEVAYEKIENKKEGVPFPIWCVEEAFRVLVEDNIDLLEETLSG